MPSRVFCDGLVFAETNFVCAEVDIVCSKFASCDIIITSDSGIGGLGVDCRNTSHSCSVFCDPYSLIYDYKCDANKSCNCNTNCATNGFIPEPIAQLGGACYRQRPASCGNSVRGGTMYDALVNGTCDCLCVNPNLTKLRSGSSWGCGDPAASCTSSSECGEPLRGHCSFDLPQQCVCYNPWGGPKCQTHMCPLCENSALCGNSTSSPCLCTGLWMGPYCNISAAITPSRPDLPGNVERCNASSLQTVPNFPPISSSPPCPSTCSQCSVDSDGTPVCLFLIPRLTDSLGARRICPSTHRCIFQCALAVGGFVDCPGPFPCDVIYQEACQFFINCSSLVGCTMHDYRSVGGSRHVRDSNFYPSTLSCVAPNGSCFCDGSPLDDITPCVPGVTCNGDPCASAGCDLSQTPNYNATTGVCSCLCRDDQVRADNGDCFIFGTRDCNRSCNYGICRDGKCWCSLGYTGDDCSQQNESCDLGLVVRNTTSCPSGCNFCVGGTCFVQTSSFVSTQETIFCPPGWGCVFICAEDCQASPTTFFCDEQSGPCELWCWGVNSFHFGFLESPAEYRPFSPCTPHTLKCLDTTRGCRSRCGLYSQALNPSPYYQARTMRMIQYGSLNITTRSATTVGPCGVGTDSCYLSQGDICYDESRSSSDLRIYGSLEVCPLDQAGQWLVPSINSTANRCDCTCGEGRVLVNGSCTALGCSPTCQNGGVCQLTANLTNPGSPAFACRCFGGWNGRDCTSRCFFPVTANVTLCENGNYRISGHLEIPTNRSVDLFGELPDLRGIVVEGNVSFGGANSTLGVGVRNASTLLQAPIINVTGDWTQLSGSVLRNSIVFDAAQGTVGPSRNLNFLPSSSR